MYIKTVEERIRDRKDSEKLALLNIELANMMIKDTFGHSMVELVMMKSRQCLKSVGALLYYIRTNDGEFAVLIPK